jgi:hypothetical protein
MSKPRHVRRAGTLEEAALISWQRRSRCILEIDEFVIDRERRGMGGVPRNAGRRGQRPAVGPGTGSALVGCPSAEWCPALRHTSNEAQAWHKLSQGLRG